MQFQSAKLLIQNEKFQDLESFRFKIFEVVPRRGLTARLKVELKGIRRLV